MQNNLLSNKRKSIIEIGNIVFWTATINNWNNLLYDDNYKEIIINSLTFINNKKKIDVYGFVIMPSHVHLIWRTNEMNGKETAQGSFLKYTAHQFKKLLLLENNEKILTFKVEAKNKKYEFWQRDPLAININSREIAFQKLEYIHNNPLAKHWHLANNPSEYKYSSAKFYETGENNYSFLKDIRDII